MKILFLNTLADPSLGGGAEQTLWTLMRALRDAGHQCVLLATNNEPGLKRTCQEGVIVWRAHIKNIYWPHEKNKHSLLNRVIWHSIDIFNPLMQRYLKRVVEFERPDIASVHNLPGWSVSAWNTLNRMNVPVVHVLHDYYLICTKTSMRKEKGNCNGQCASCGAFRLPHTRISRKVSAVIGVSEFVLDAHLKQGFFNDSMRCVIHNARDPNVLGIDSEAPPIENNANSVIRFGFIGRLDATKGVELLIDSYLEAGIKNSELWIAGAGTDEFEANLRMKAADPRIKLLGRTKPKDFYPFVDVLVVPSLWNEPLGMVVAEGLSFGKPVIASRRGGIPEMIRNGFNGLLFDPSCRGELTTCLQLVANNPEILDSLGKNARPSSQKYLDVASWAAKYESIYLQLRPENA